MLKTKYTAEDIEIRIWGFVVVCITVILFGIVFVLLYSLIFVVQPIKSMAPLDMAFSKILNDIVLLLVGGIGGIVGKRAVGSVSQAMNPTPPAPAPAAPAARHPQPRQCLLPLYKIHLGRCLSGQTHRLMRAGRHRHRRPHRPAWRMTQSASSRLKPGHQSNDRPTQPLPDPGRSCCLHLSLLLWPPQRLGWPRPRDANRNCKEERRGQRD